MAGVSPGRGAAVLFAGAVACAAVLSACAVPWSVLARFAVLIAAFVLAGRLLAPRDLQGAEGAAAALVIGMVVATLLWAGALLVGLPPRASFLMLGALAVAGGATAWRRPGDRLSAPIAGAALACGATVAWTQFGNGLLEANGARLSFANTYAREALFHCAIAQEMRYGLVVHLPAGASLPYHVGYHLLSAITAEATGASMLDVSYRLLPALLAPAAALAAAGFAESWGAGPIAATGGALLLFFADDLSWVFGAAGVQGTGPVGSPAWNVLLGTPLLYGFHHNRGFLLGALVFFPALGLLGRYLRNGGRHELAAGAALTAALFHCKVSYFVISIAAVSFAGAISVLAGGRATREVRDRCIKAALLGFLIAAPFLGAFLLGRPAGDATRFAPFPAYIGVGSLVRLGFFPDWDAVGIAARSDPSGFAVRWLPFALLLFAVGTLGVRAIGLRELIARARSREPLALLAAGVVVVAFIMGLTLYTPPDRGNIAYFWATALLVLAVLSGVELFDSAQGIRRHLGLLGAAAVLGLPGTVQFLWVERSAAIEPSLAVPSGVLEAADHLAMHALPGDVVLEPDVSSSVLAALAPVRPVMAWADWLRNSLGKLMVQERIRDVRAFFAEGDLDTRRRVLDRYGVRWVWSPVGVTTGPIPGSRRVIANSAGELWRVD